MGYIAAMDAICVYCSAAARVEPTYFDAAREVGRLIAERAGTLVFGGNCLGCMNAVAESVHAHGGRVVGVTPQLMHDQGTSYEQADELIVTPDMRRRKAEMERRADAFVVLAGGFGTLEELFEILVHRHMGYHDKPIVLLNTAGYYDPLVEMFEHMTRSGFVREVYQRFYRVVETPEAVFEALDQWGVC